MAGLKPILITAFGLGVAAFVLPAPASAASTTSIPPVYVLFPPARPLIVIVPPPRPGMMPAPVSTPADLSESTPPSAPESVESVLSEPAPSIPSPPAVLASLDVLPPPRPSAPAPDQTAAVTPPATSPAADPTAGPALVSQPWPELQLSIVPPPRSAALAALQPAPAPTPAAPVPPNLPDTVTTLEPTDDIDEVLLIPDQSERADLQKSMIEQVVLDQAAQDQGDSLTVLSPENPRIMAAKTPEPRLLQPQNTAPAARPKLGSVTSILFAPEDNQLDDVSRVILQHFISGIKIYSVRLQLLAYAGAPGDQRSPARRLALKRALEIRDYLMAAGITPEQIDVRALGGALEGPPDRVELILLQ